MGNKEQTLEEAAIKRYGSDQYLWAQQREGFIEGAKSQQEKMYSEEDMTNYALYILHNNVITPKEWFEQFKKK